MYLTKCHLKQLYCNVIQESLQHTIKTEVMKYLYEMSCVMLWKNDILL